MALTKEQIKDALLLDAIKMRRFRGPVKGQEQRVKKMVERMVQEADRAAEAIAQALKVE